MLEVAAVFCGIVEEVGVVASAREGAGGAETHFVLRTKVAPRLRVGHSLAVDGVCLTVTRASRATVAVTAVAETLALTTLGRLRAGARVNLEAALRAGEPLGGHLVQGHVEGVGRVRAIERLGESEREQESRTEPGDVRPARMQGAATKKHWKYFEERRRGRRDGAPRAWRREGFLLPLSVEMTIDAPPDLLRYVAHKGSIAVDGVSLTVAALDERGFRVALIPHTLAATTLGDRRAGDAVNLETDLLAKYVERLMGAGVVSRTGSGITLGFLREHGFA